MLQEATFYTMFKNGMETGGCIPAWENQSMELYLVCLAEKG
jgi:hypothetical protein